MLSYLIWYYGTHSSEYLTHIEFFNSLSAIAVAFFSGLIGILLYISEKMEKFAEKLGKLDGKLNQFIEFEMQKNKRK